MRFLPLVLGASVTLAGPVRLDVSVHLDVIELESRTFAKNTAPQTKHATFNKPQPIIEQPIVNLTYGARHKASPPLTPDQKYYNFSNIPYAQQPIGKLRFQAAKPLEDAKGEQQVNDGQSTVVCPQAQAGWVPHAAEFVQNYLNTLTPLDSKWNNVITPEKNYTWTDKVPKVPLMDEACLTLDVLVPKRVFDDEYAQVPVMVWFFGGGYVYGSKTLFGSPAGLWEAANQLQDEDGDFVYVGVNYRLGAFGWLAGDSFEKAGGFENAGFSDQVAALDWVEKNIVLFGGYSGGVTVVGESAGASSILHHITSYGGYDRYKDHPEPKFRRAILQSPAYFPITNRVSMEQTYQKFLKEAGAKDFNSLLNAKTEDLIRANSKTSYESPYGRFSYGPVLDDTFVPIPPPLALKFGKTWLKDSIMVSYNKDEGILFTPPWVRDSKSLREYVLAAYPDYIPEELDALVDRHYIYDSGLKTERAKLNVTSQLMSDFGVRSTVSGLREKGSRYGCYEYSFNMFPGLHGQDANYTFGPTNNPEWDAKNTNKDVRQAMQRYIVGFINYGDPNSLKLASDPDFDPYYYEHTHMRFGSGTVAGIPIDPRLDSNYSMAGDILNKTRSDYWDYAPYWNPPQPSSAAHLLRTQDGDTMSDSHFEV